MNRKNNIINLLNEILKEEKAKGNKKTKHEYIKTSTLPFESLYRTDPQSE